MQGGKGLAKGEWVVERYLEEGKVGGRLGGMSVKMESYHDQPIVFTSQISKKV